MADITPRPGQLASAIAIAAAGLFLVSQPVFGQNIATPAPPLANTDAFERVTVDLDAQAFDRVLPFDVPFFLTGLAPAGTVSLNVQYAEVPKSGPGLNADLRWLPDDPAAWKPDTPAIAGQAFVAYLRQPLAAGRRYAFRFTFLRQIPVDPTAPVDGRTQPRTDDSTKQVIVSGRTAGNVYVSADVGLLYAGDIETGALYIGSNIYFRPVNKKAPLSEVSSFARRFAVTLGITVTSIADEDERTRSDLFANQALVIGAGYRLTRSLRAGGGALVFREADPNPLITRKSAAMTWYVLFSYDLDIAKGLASIGNEPR